MKVIDWVIAGVLDLDFWALGVLTLRVPGCPEPSFVLMESRGVGINPANYDPVYLENSSTGTLANMGQSLFVWLLTPSKSGFVCHDVLYYGLGSQISSTFGE